MSSLFGAIVGIGTFYALYESWLKRKWKARVNREAHRSFYLGQVDQFAREGSRPYFEQVRGMMGTLLQNGQAADLQEAYDRAVAVYVVEHQMKSARR